MLAINPNDAVSGYYQVAQTLADKRQNNRRRLPRSWPIPAITSVLISRRESHRSGSTRCVCQRRGRRRAVPYRNAVYGSVTARRTSKRVSKPTSRCYWQRATSRLSSAQWTSEAIKASDLNIPQEENPFLGYRAVRIYPEFVAVPHQLRDFARCQFRQRPVDDPDGSQPRSDLMGEGRDPSDC